MLDLSIPAKAAPDSKGERLIDVAYRELKNDIVTCALYPGSEVTEAQLALRCGVGKAAVRAALMQLAQEKLVTPLPRRGYQITPVTLRDVHDLFHLRGLLEPEAVRLAVGRVDVKKLAELDAICAAGCILGDRKSEERLLRANRAFHSLYIDACGNERLSAILTDVLDQMTRLFHVGLSLWTRREEMRSQHTRLVDAFLNGDKELAANVTSEHNETMRRVVIDGILSLPAIMDAHLTSNSSTPREGVRA
jgi:DNA-binding GntR family transcriptional regulator